MSTKCRKQHAKRLLRSLEVLEKEWLEDNEEAQKANSPSHTKRRERLKAIEAQTALIRLMQSESRLKQQILLGIGSFASGSLIMWFVQRLIGS